MIGYADTSDIRLNKKTLFGRSEQTGLRYIKEINIDRLLAPLYEMHGLSAPNGAERYGGWERKRANNWTADGGAESHTLAGHSLGHWMSAASMFYKSTSDSEILNKLSYAVNKLDELQSITGSAYIGGCPEDTFIKCFAGEEDWAENYWVPWYGIHKIYQGLVDAYLCSDDMTSATAFKVLKKFADWAVCGTENLSDEFMQRMLNVEYGGMNEIFALMYKFTGEEKYLYTAERFTHNSIINPLVEGIDSLTGLHANTQIPKIVGAAEIYEQNNDLKYRKASENLWDFVVNNRSYAIGGNSIAEHFEAEGLESLGIKTCESCNTYNMMRLTEHLFAWEHKSEYMDWYEDALFNHILGQQEPESGEKMYFISLLPGHHRVYEEKGKSWWCCTGTGMENPGRYTRVIYFEENDDLYINLYIENEYKWKSKGLELKIETDYPYSEKIRIIVTNGNDFANIKLRVPSWSCNMRAFAAEKEYCQVENGYISIGRKWNKGDQIDIEIPMSVRAHYARSGGNIAFKYGPVTLGAELGSVRNVKGVAEYITNETRIDSVTADVPYIITNGEEASSLVKIYDRDKLIFKIEPQNISSGKAVMLKPFYEIHHMFYSVYFHLDSEGDVFEKKLNDITIDRVEPDGQQDELGHGLVTNTAGNIHCGSFSDENTNYMYRNTWGKNDDGSNELPYFSYRLSVENGINYLYVLYRADNTIISESGRVYTRDYSIYADGVKLGKPVVRENRSKMVIYEFYKIPETVVLGKGEITVKFEAESSDSYAEVSELRITSDIIKIK